MRDLKTGFVIGFKSGLSAYVVLGIIVVCFLAPMPMCFVAGDVIPKALDMIWGD